MDIITIETILLGVVLWNQFTLGKTLDRVLNRIADLEDRLILDNDD